MLDRGKYLGSSDAPDILSDDWTRMYAEKVGEREREDLSDAWPVQLGICTEPLHLDWLTKKNPGWEWSKAPASDPENQHFSSFTPKGTKAVLGSHPDALLKLPDGRVLPVEVKQTGRWRNVDECADFYMPQLQHHMLCWGVDLILMSAIIGTAEPTTIWIGASEPWQEHYVERAVKFWQHIEAKHPPVKPLYATAPGKVKVPTAVKDSVPFNGQKKRSLAESNLGPQLIAEYNQTKIASVRHELVKGELKAMMQDDECELYHDALTIKRNKAGSKLIKVHDPEWGVEPTAPVAAE